MGDSFVYLEMQVLQDLGVGGAGVQQVCAKGGYGVTALPRLDLFLWSRVGDGAALGVVDVPAVGLALKEGWAQASAGVVDGGGGGFVYC